MTAALTPGRRTLLLFGTPVSILFILYGALAIVNAIGLTHYTDNFTVVADGQIATVKADKVGVHVEPSPDGKVHVRVTGLYTLSKPKLTVVAAGATLTVKGGCTQVAVIACSQNVVVQLPAASTLTVSSNAGDVRASGLTGTLHLSSSAGDVRDDGAAGTLTMISTAGDVSGTNLRSATVSASSSAGDVNLTFVTPPEQVEAGSSAGDVHVRVPDVGYDLSVRSSVGDIQTTVKSDPSSPRTIDAHSSAGDVSVRPS